MNPPMRGWIRGLVLTFVLVAVARGLAIREGLSFTDDGFVLTTQRMSAVRSPLYETSALWLMDSIGGAWLSFGDWAFGWGGELLFARIGGVLLAALTGCVAYTMLVKAMRPIASAATIGAFAAISSTGAEVIGYIGLSTLFVHVAAAGLLRAFHAETRAARIATGTAAGAMVALAGYSKITVFTSVAIPVALLLGRRLAKVPVRRAHVVASLAFGAGAVVATLSGLLYLRGLGRLDSFLDVFRGRSSFGSHEFYTFGKIVAVYATQCGWLVATGALATCVLAIVLHLTRALTLRSRALAGAVVVLAVAAAAALLAPSSAIDLRTALTDRKSALAGVTLAALTVHFVILRRPVQVPAADDEPGLALRVDLVSLALAVPVFAAAGSATFVWTGFGAMWFSLPFAVLALPVILRRFVPGRMAAAMDDARFAVLGRVCVAGAFVLGLTVHWFAPYQDVRNPLSRAPIEDVPGLRGIRTTPARAASVAELLSEVRRRVPPGSPLLAIDEIPLVYFLTQTDAVLGNPWASQVAKRILTARMDELGGTRPLPAAVVCSKTDPHRREWGTTSLEPTFDRDGTTKLLMDRVAALGFEEVWSSRDFSVWMRRPPR